MTRTEIKVDGMTCGGCVASVQNALMKRDGVVDANADLASGIVSITFDSASIQQQDLVSAIVEAGFEVGARA